MRSAIIVAGGQSNRYGQDKLALNVVNQSVLEMSVNAFRQIADEIVVVGAHVEGTLFAQGGATRSQSAANGLQMVSKQCNVVAVHDGARPFVSRSLVKQLFEQAECFGSAVPCVAVTDTVWQLDGDKQNQLKRDQLVAVQTPQVFNCAKLRKAFDGCDTFDFTDESTLFAKCFGSVHFVQGECTNKKITYKGDLPDFRIGTGVDVHAFGKGNGVRLGGVDIAFDKSLVGHSDADVVCHAICDAILSACGHKDIGHQFPVDDDKYLGIDSMLLLDKCVSLAQDSGFNVVNCSAVVVCELPKLAPHIDKMRDCLAKTLGIATECVNVSATTSEKLGMLGNGDGIACQAQVLMIGNA